MRLRIPLRSQLKTLNANYSAPNNPKATHLVLILRHLYKIGVFFGSFLLFEKLNNYSKRKKSIKTGGVMFKRYFVLSFFIWCSCPFLPVLAGKTSKEIILSSWNVKKVLLSCNPPCEFTSLEKDQKVCFQNSEKGNTYSRWHIHSHY